MAREIKTLLQSGNVVAHLHEQIRQMEKINTLLQAHFPHVTAASVRAIKLQNATLTLRAPNSPIAARLRQSTPSIIKTLTEQGVFVESLRISVHTQNYRETPPKTKTEPRTLGLKGQQAIERLAASLPKDDRLRVSLEGLLLANKQP